MNSLALGENLSPTLAQRNVKEPQKCTNKDVNCKNEFGQTALMTAAATGNIHDIKELLRNGARESEFDKFGATPLMYAIANNNYSAERYLSVFPANIDKNEYRKLCQQRLKLLDQYQLKDIQTLYQTHPLYNNPSIISVELDLLRRKNIFQTLDKVDLLESLITQSEPMSTDLFCHVSDNFKKIGNYQRYMTSFLPGLYSVSKQLPKNIFEDEWQTVINLPIPEKNKLYTLYKLVNLMPTDVSEKFVEDNLSRLMESSKNSLSTHPQTKTDTDIMLPHDFYSKRIFEYILKNADVFNSEPFRKKTMGMFNKSDLYNEYVDIFQKEMKSRPHEIKTHKKLMLELKKAMTSYSPIQPKTERICACVKQARNLPINQESFDDIMKLSSYWGLTYPEKVDLMDSLFNMKNGSVNSNMVSEYSDKLRVAEYSEADKVEKLTRVLTLANGQAPSSVYSGLEKQIRNTTSFSDFEKQNRLCKLIVQKAQAGVSTNLGNDVQKLLNLPYSLNNNALPVRNFFLARQSELTPEKMLMCTSLILNYNAGSTVFKYLVDSGKNILTPDLILSLYKMLPKQSKDSNAFVSKLLNHTDSRQLNDFLYLQIQHARKNKSVASDWSQLARSLSKDQSKNILDSLYLHVFDILLNTPMMFHNRKKDLTTFFNTLNLCSNSQLERLNPMMRKMICETPYNPLHPKRNISFIRLLHNNTL